MFQDVSSNSVSLPSTWKKEKSKTDGHSQTSEILSYDAVTQSTETDSKAIQTDKPLEKPYKLVVDNSAELREFLLRVEPVVCAALKRNEESRAFEGYEACWEEETTGITCTYTLTNPALSAELHCTGLSWNCTGSVLAVCYGRHDHQDWCAHKSSLCTWNLHRRTVDPKKPDVSIDLPNCLMCVCFHPDHPALIAVGTFSGEVRVCNIGSETDSTVATSGFSEFGHNEPIAKVCWIPAIGDQMRKERYQVLSLGNDGKILVWELSSDASQKGHLQLLKRMQLRAEGIPRSLRVGRVNMDAEMGGTSMSFTAEDESVFVAGCENGTVVKCSLDSPSSLEDAVVQCPVRFAFKPHQGPVYSVACAPFHRNMFLSCGTDTTVRLYSLLDASPLLIFEPGEGYLFSLAWSPSRPLVFAVGTAGGHLLLYDLKHSHIKPTEVVLVCEDRKSIYCLQYNPKQSRVLATGDGRGVVRVWRLSSSLTVQGSSEINQLSELAAGTI